MLLVLAALPARAQNGETYEFWPEFDLVHRLNDRTKVIVLADTNRDLDSGPAYQGELGVSLDHRFTDVISGRLGYRHANALDGSAFREDRLLAEQTFRVALPALVTVDFRTREDFRCLNSGFSVRLRQRIWVQRETTIGNYIFTPYVSAEVYFVGERLSIEPYLARQVDFAGTPAISNALGMILTVNF